jgi:hypothetical protein
VCVISGLRNGARYLVTVRPTAEAGTTISTRLLRAIPQPAILSSLDTMVWFDASDYATIKSDRPGPVRIGSRVVELRDKSPHHFDATQPETAREPTLGQLGGAPALLFDGNDILSVDGRSFPLGNQPSTVVVVAAQDDPAPETSCFHNLLSWGAGEGGQARILYKGCHTSLAFAETGGTDVEQHPTRPWPIGRPAVMSAVVDGAGTSVRLDGVPSYQWAAPTSPDMNAISTSGVRVGGTGWDPDARWVGRIGEVSSSTASLLQQN